MLKDIFSWNRKVYLKLILLLLFKNFVTPTNIYGQSKSGKYLDGYYINNLGDTLMGLISIEDDLVEKIYFKRKLDDSITTIGVEHCQAFFLENLKFERLTNITLKGRVISHFHKQIFAKVLEEGRLNLYVLNYTASKKGLIHYLSLASQFSSYQLVGSIMDKKHTCYLLRSSNDTTYNQIDHKKKKFKRELMSFVSDDIALINKIRIGGDYSYDNIEAIIHEYNVYKKYN